MPLLANVLISTARKGYTPSTKVTSGANTYLSGVRAHLEPNMAHAYTTLPDAAFTAPYYLVLDSGTDVAAGDFLLSITLLDGVTPWPDEVAAANSGVVGQDITTWAVVYARETAAGLIPAREVYIDRLTTQGPAHV